MSPILWKGVMTLAAACGALGAMARPVQVAGQAPKGWADAVRLSSFGERPTFSPDGTRVAFVGKSFGDAYEIDLRTKRVRNLTGNVPHQGIMRVQYLADGNYLITGPRLHTGPESRGAGELWVLDKSLDRGLMPLDQPVSEGTAVSRRGNIIAFTVPGTPFDPSTPLKSTFSTAEVAYPGGVPTLVGKRSLAPDGVCNGETQDFRDQDREVTVSCYEWPSTRYGFGAAAYGINRVSGKLIKYRDIPTEYNEIEGISGDGSWSAVECSERANGAPNVGLADISRNPEKFLNPIDLCRLEMTPGGKLAVLFKATAPGSTRKANNPVISPDGKWMAFASSDNRAKAVGSGDGIYLLALTD